TTVFWIAVVPAFVSLAIIVFAVREPDLPPNSRKVRSPFSRAELGRLSRAYWLVVGVSAIFTLARFSEAFLLLRAQSVGLQLALVPAGVGGGEGVFFFISWPARGPVGPSGPPRLAPARAPPPGAAALLSVC